MYALATNHKFQAVVAALGIALSLGTYTRVYRRVTTMGPYDQFLLFGDSITQFSCSQERGFAFTPALQDAYIRRLDVINRGFSGYNTSQALKALPEFMPTPAQARLRFMTVFFGANDACVPGGPTGQHVPLDQYMRNVQAIVRHPLVSSHTARLILITPPPFDEHQSGDGIRTAEHTKKYADACRQVGKELGVAVLDLWSVFMTKAGWKPGQPLAGSKAAERNKVLGELLHDGLHFSPMGYRILYDEVVRTIEREWPDQAVGNTGTVLPSWEAATGETA